MKEEKCELKGRWCECDGSGSHEQRHNIEQIARSMSSTDRKDRREDASEASFGFTALKELVAPTRERNLHPTTMRDSHSKLSHAHRGVLEENTGNNGNHWSDSYHEEAWQRRELESTEAHKASLAEFAQARVHIVGDSAQQQTTSSKKATTSPSPKYRRGLEEDDDEASVLPPVTPPTCSHDGDVNEKHGGRVHFPTEVAQCKTNQYEDDELKDVCNKASDDVMDYDEENAMARTHDFFDGNTQVSDADDGNEDNPCQEFWKEEFQEWSVASVTDCRTTTGSKVDSKTIIAEPIEEDEMDKEVRRQVRSELCSEMQARMSVATPLSPNESKGNFWTRKRLITIATLVLLAIVGIVVGVVVGTREPPPDPNTIRGQNNGDRFGWFTAISRDGKTIAVGADEGNYAQVFRWSGSAWQQLGQTLYGDHPGDQFGRVFDLNRNGSMLVVGAWNNGENISKAGQAKVYQYDGTLWNQVGEALLGDATEDKFGYYVSMSDDGKSVAVSGRDGDPSPDRFNAGYVRMFVFSGNLRQGQNQWIKLGSDLVGEAEGEEFGKSLAMSADGRRLAVSTARWNESRGRVRVFDFIGHDWRQVGNDLRGNHSEDYLGSSIALSKDGSILAVGADEVDINGNNTGWAGVYELEGDAWKKRGQDLSGEMNHARFGIHKVSLSDDGNCLAAGANHHDNGRGKGYLFRWNDTHTHWDQIAAISGERPGDQFGEASSISGDCKVAVFGAPEYDTEGSPPGYVKIYYV